MTSFKSFPPPENLYIMKLCVTSHMSLDTFSLTLILQYLLSILKLTFWAIFPNDLEIDTLKSILNECLIYNLIFDKNNKMKKCKSSIGQLIKKHMSG